MEHLNLQQMLDYDSGEISAAERAAVKGHLDSCPRCRGEIEELRGEIKHVKSVFPAEPDAIFWEYYLPRLKKRMYQGVESSAGRITQWSAGLAAAAVAVMLVLMLNLAPRNVELSGYYEGWTAYELYNSVPETTDEVLIDIAMQQLSYEDAKDILTVDDEVLTDLLLKMSEQEIEEVISTIKQTQIL